jgi:hypothetical protein
MLGEVAYSNIGKFKISCSKTKETKMSRKTVNVVI